MPTSASASSAKPLLTNTQIINMSVGFFGIQFVFGLQNANVSRIFQSLGAKVEDIPILWLAAPVTGLIIQPIIGHYSDRTWMGKWGRRRPFFMLGALFAALALLVFPSVHELLIAAIMLWILDASINVSMEPFRAFVGDMLPHVQRTRGFAAQSFFIGIGAVISSVLPWLLTRAGVNNVAPEGSIPDSVRLSFYIGAAVIIAAIAYTVFTTKEYSPADLKRFAENEEEHSIEIKTSAAIFYRNGIKWLALGIISTLVLYFYNQSASKPFSKEVYVLTLGIFLFGLLQLIAGWLKGNQYKNGFLEIMDDLNYIPTVMKKLAVVQFFTWFGLFSMWIYATPALAMHIHHTNDTGSKLYNDMSDWVGVLFGFYNGFAALFALFLPAITRKLGRPNSHLLALVIGGLGLISFYFITNQYWLILSMAAIGFAWCCILSLPYSMLTASLPSHKMGVFMGIFNFFIVIPQILAASLLGLFVTFVFGGNTIYSLILGGISMIVAGLLTLRIKEPKQP